MTENNILYAGITLGPVVSTMELTSTPAGLWCASGLFSYLSESICRQISEKLKDSGAIINPYFTDADAKEEKYRIQKNGIGSFHDRIFIRAICEKATFEKIINEAVDSAIDGIAKEISEAVYENETDKKNAKAFIKDYFHIHYVIKEGEPEENCVLALSPFLDSLEWMPSYSGKPGKNPFLRLFEGGDHSSRNKYVKNCFMVPSDKKNFQLMKNDKIRDLSDIAGYALRNCDENGNNKSEAYKRNNFFAVVQADADSMGNLLKNSVGKSTEALKLFSKACMEYTSAAAELIGTFGGMTIYAGGDDLLFIAPVENGITDGKARTIFDLCAEIRKVFKQKFEKLENDLSSIKKTNGNGTECFNGFSCFPTVSFGISVNYYKFPLREALAEARELLFVDAKNYKSKIPEGKNEPEFIKNATALILRKPSGQMGKFVFKSGGVFETNLTKLLNESLKNIDGSDKALHSIMFHLRNGKKYTQTTGEGFDYNMSTYEVILESSKNKKIAFDHLFDSAAHDVSRDYIDRIYRTYTELSENCAELAETTPFDTLNQMLWMTKFFTEKPRKEKNK